MYINDRELIKEWFLSGRNNDASHVIIAEEESMELCTITMPIYIFPEQDVEDQVNRYNTKDMKIVYVLDLKENMEEQIEVGLACMNSKSKVEN